MLHFQHGEYTYFIYEYGGEPIDIDIQSPEIAVRLNAIYEQISLCCICHNDVRSSNIVYQESDFKVIDFETAEKVGTVNQARSRNIHALQSVLNGLI